MGLSLLNQLVSPHGLFFLFSGPSGDLFFRGWTHLLFSFFDHDYFVELPCSTSFGGFLVHSLLQVRGSVLLQRKSFHFPDLSTRSVLCGRDFTSTSSDLGVAPPSSHVLQMAPVFVLSWLLLTPQLDCSWTIPAVSEFLCLSMDDGDCKMFVLTCKSFSWSVPPFCGFWWPRVLLTKLEARRAQDVLCRG